jgi:arsenical pump membrane protein
MALSIATLCISCVSIVIFTALNLNVHIKKFKIHLYWVIPFICAVVLLATGTVKWDVFAGNLSDFSSNMNPLKVLILFISMSCLSIFLDQAGMFRFLAAKALRFAGKSQIKLFVLLYLIIALLTIITSNSTIILTFTPFICYFAKHCGINPIPFLFTEFAAANTWSMFLLIGNATNTYIAYSFDISFVEYISVMALPTVFAAIVSFAMLLILFGKQLKEPLSFVELEVQIKNLPALIVGVIGLGVCTVLLIVSSYVGLEMWLISSVSAVTVMVAGTICYLAKKQGMYKTNKTLRRMPWHLVPFLLSMYVVILSLDNAGVTDKLSQLLSNDYPILTFGALSALSSNFMNNIPMSLLFTPILKGLDSASSLGGVYATIIGSNMGSLLTPIASMSAIMWRSVIRHKHVDFSFGKFVKYGLFMFLPTISAALGGLMLMMFLMG